MSYVVYPAFDECYDFLHWSFSRQLLSYVGYFSDNNNYKRMKQHDDYSVTDYKRNPMTEMKSRDQKEMNMEYITILADYWKNNLTTVFKRKKDLDVANAVIELIDMKDRIDNFNKKALYILIREMTGSNTQHITRVINQMKRYYFNMMEEFSAVGEIDTSNTCLLYTSPSPRD